MPDFVDAADVYSNGVSEEITGRALRGVRDDVVLATKVRFPMGEGPNDVGLSRKHIMQGCEDSLRRLGTEYIDLYQVHCWDAATPLEETLSALTDLVRSGKVRARTLEQLEDNIGASGRELTAEQVEELSEASALEDVYPYRFIRNAQRV